MIGKINTIIADRNFGFIKGENGEEFFFQLRDFTNIDNIEDLGNGNSVDFDISDIKKGKNREAINIMYIKNNSRASYKDTYETQTMEEVAKEHPISLDKLIDIAEELDIPYIFNSNSYTSVENIDRIIKHFYKENNQKANINNSNFNINFETTQESDNEISVFRELIENDYKIFIDTSSLMHFHSNKVIENEIIPYLKEFNKQVYIVDSVINEIQRQKNSTNINIVKKAKTAEYVLNNLNKDNLYVIPNTQATEKDFADKELLNYFSDIRTKYNLCLITNDNSYKNNGNLSADILNLKQQNSIKSNFDIKVFYINKDDNNPKLAEFSIDVDSNLSTNVPKRVNL